MFQLHMPKAVGVTALQGGNNRKINLSSYNQLMGKLFLYTANKGKIQEEKLIAYNNFDVT